jgi:hypothetical protein
MHGNINTVSTATNLYTAVSYDRKRVIKFSIGGNNIIILLLLSTASNPMN